MSGFRIWWAPVEGRIMTATDFRLLPTCLALAACLGLWFWPAPGRAQCST